MAKKRKRSGIGMYEKLILLKESKGRCAYCLSTIKSQYYCIDHIKPFCQNGKDETENYILICKSCNSQKGGKTLEEYCGWLLSKRKLTRHLFNLLLWFEKNIQKRNKKLEKLYLKEHRHKYGIKTYKELNQLYNYENSI